MSRRLFTLKATIRNAIGRALARLGLRLMNKSADCMCTDRFVLAVEPGTDCGINESEEDEPP